MSLTTIAKLKCEIKDTVREELLEELSYKKVDVEKECQELLNKTNKEYDSKIEECNFKCVKRERETKEYCDKLHYYKDVLKTTNSSCDDIKNYKNSLNRLYCLNEKETIIDVLNKKVDENNESASPTPP